MSTLEIIIPDIGSFDDVDVIEVLVSVGDNIKTDDPLITLETEKASMDIPATVSGVIKELKIKVGDKVKEGSLIGLLETKNVTEEKVQEKPNLKIPEEKITEKLVSEPTRPSQEPPTKIKPEYTPLPVGESNLVSNDKSSHASPSTRKFARNLGVNITFINGTGPKNRILVEDIQAYVKKKWASLAQKIWVINLHLFQCQILIFLNLVLLKQSHFLRLRKYLEPISIEIG